MSAIGNASELPPPGVRRGVSARVRAHVVPAAVLAGGIVTTAIVAAMLAHTAAQRDEQAFAAAASAAQDAVLRRVETSIALLRGTAGLFAAKVQPVTVESFRAYVDRIALREQYPGLLGLGFSRRLDPSERDALEDEMRQQGQAGFRVWPDGAREEVHSIVFLEPLDRRNRAAIGYDMYTHPVRRAAMSCARDLGRACASGVVELVQEIDERKQPGFLIYLPVYRDAGIPADPAARRGRLIGFAYSPIRAVDFLSSAFPREATPQIALAVYHGTQPRSEMLLYAHSPAGMPAQPRFVRTTQVEVAGQPWTFEFRSPSAAAEAWIVPSLVAAAGLALSLLFAAFWRRQQAAADALHEEARMLDLLNRVGMTLAGELDLEHTVQAVTNAATELSGAQFGAFFYNVVGPQGESYQLYTLSGAPREAFEKFGMPRNTPVFKPTFSGEGIVRSEDITKDARYGTMAPHHGMPKGHLPVRSYLAVPVRTRLGEVLGGLFFGHPQPGVFGERAERLVSGIAAQAAVAIDNARLYERTRKLVDDLRESDRRKDEFIAMLSHELRNPLAPLKSALELMRLEAPAGSDASLRAMMERQVAQLVRLVDDLLESSRISRGLLELRREPLELGGVLRTAVELAEPLIREAGHRLEIDLPRASLWLQGDAVRLVQAFANLLNNAARYTPRGGSIWLRAAPAQGRVSVSVRDTGTGLSQERKQRLFEMFSRGEGSSGLGIGLALTRKLVELHGGTIEAHSDGEGRGAEFMVTLPLCAAPKPAAPPVTAASRGGLRVLVADDNRDAAESLAALLRALGNEVSLAYDGVEAVAAARTLRPQVVLLDIGMPRLDGYAAAREIRQDPQAQRIKIVALTGWGQEEDRRRAREAGFDDHLVKPVELEVLRRVLAEVNPETMH